MTRNQLTTSYLKEIDRLGLPPDWLATAAREHFDLAAASYEDRCLSRPVFLDHVEQAQLAHDLDRLHAALAGLPDQLFGGDVEQFARAVGLTGPQVAAVGRAGTAEPTRLGRADLYHDGTGFRLMELNLGSNIGGLDTALLNGA